MATARISQTFADGTAVTVSAEIKDNFPDALAEYIARVAELWSRVVPGTRREGAVHDVR